MVRVSLGLGSELGLGLGLGYGSCTGKKDAGIHLTNNTRPYIEFSPQTSAHYHEKQREGATHRYEICSEDSYRRYGNNIGLEF